MLLKSLRPLAPYLKKYRSAYVWGGLCVLLMNGTWILFPLVIRHAINDLWQGVTLHKLWTVSLVLLLVAVVKGIFQFLTRWIVIGASREIEFDLRNDLFRHLEGLSYSFYQRTRTGDIMARATNDLNAVRMLLGPAIMYSANTIVFTAGALIFMFAISPRLTLYAFLPLPVVSIVDMIRQRCPETTIVVGGPLIYNLVHDLDDETLQGTFRAMGADIYVRESQGEATLASIMKCLQSGGNLADIPNCYINSTSGFQFTKHVPENNPIEECSIDWDSFEDWELGDTVQMRTARSCAFKCSFCDYPLRAGALSAAEVATVERELRQLARRRVRNVVFIDDTFNVPIGRFCKICEMMIANDFPFSWFSYFRCSNAKDPAVFDLLSHSGCAGVFLGVESADETVLANMNKRAHGDDYRRGIAEFNKRNIASFASLIVGFPGETQQSITNTINFLNEACPTFYRVEPLWYNVRAPIAKDAERFGLSGSAFRWKHSTMEANTAADGAQRIFEEVHGPAWMPMYMFDFWALPYLMGKGMKLQEMVEFHQHAYRAMSCAIAGENSAPPLNDIARMFSKTELQPSRYRLEPSVLTE